MGNTGITSTPYDDVFRTLLNDCSPLIIPVINEIFGEHYSGQETITFSPNEHFLNRQDGKEEERITDTSFTIEGSENLSHQGAISEYTKCTLIDMSNKVLEHIAVKYHSVREGVKTIMSGKVLEYEAKAIKREGREEGRNEGRNEGIRGTVSILKSLGLPAQTILTKIQEQYNLSPEASQKYL